VLHPIFRKLLTEDKRSTETGYSNENKIESYFSKYLVQDGTAKNDRTKSDIVIEVPGHRDPIGIEVKKVRDKNHAKKLNEEIIIDKEYYSNNPNITQLYFFIYDPDVLLLNREDFIEDLEKTKSEQFQYLKIVIKPDL